VWQVIFESPLETYWPLKVDTVSIGLTIVKFSHIAITISVYHSSISFDLILLSSALYQAIVWQKIFSFAVHFASLYQQIITFHYP